MSLNRGSGSIQRCRLSLSDQDYYASRITYILTGCLGVDNARLDGFNDNEVVYGPGGYFEVRVNWGSNVVLTPKLEGHTFSPSCRRLSQVKENMQALDFEARAKTCKIIGEVVVKGKTRSGDSDVRDQRWPFGYHR